MSRFVFPAILLMAATAFGAPPEPGQLDASQTLFTVMAAINAVGYDADLQSPNCHPIRNAIRAELAKKKISVLPDIKAFFEAHRRKNDTLELNQYITFALAVKGPPDFAFKARDVEVPPEALELQGLAPLLERFYQEAGIPDLWARSQAAIDQYVARYHEPVAKAVLEVNSYLRNDTGVSYMGRRFQIFVELQAAPNQIQTRSFGNEYFVVVTPSADVRIDDIRHAYLFFLLDPLATRSTEILNRKRGLIDHAQRAWVLPEIYKVDFLLLTTASLVKAVEARLDRNPKLVGEALAQGYILAPYFSEQLTAYEKQEQAMRFYYPEMAQAIDLRKEDARLSKVEFTKDAPVRQAKRPAAPAGPVLTGAARTIEEAEQFYTSRDIERARQAFMQVLRQTDDRPMQARAYYGLARIAALERNPELAEQLFEKTIESSPDPQVKAWTHVYLGRLADAAGDREQAARHYQDALKVEGAPEAARQAAEQGVQQSFKRQEK